MLVKLAMHVISAIDVVSNAIRMISLEERQQDMITLLVRSHRKTMSTSQDENFKPLTQIDRSIVNKLCAVLRLADAVEVSHTNRIHRIKLEKSKKS